METLYAAMITLLFSAWVWDLKGQVTSLRHAGISAPEAVEPQFQPPSRPVNVRHQSNATRQTPPPDDTAQHGVTRHNGIPTWVIN